MRNILTIIFTAIIFYVNPLIGFAETEQTLVIPLDPPSQNSTPKVKKDIVLNHQPLKSTGSLSASAASNNASKQTVIGKIGKVKTSAARIQRNPTNKSQNLFDCKKGMPLPIISEINGWYGVLMVDGSTGWVEKKNIEMLDFQLMGTGVNIGNAVSSQFGTDIVNYSLKYIGIPYKWGGTTANGLDCSAFVRSVFSKYGISLPRVARDQARVGQEIGWSDLQPGDRLYFNCKGGPVDHAGIYIGNGLFIHSSTGKGGVDIDKITTPLFAKSLVSARR